MREWGHHDEAGITQISPWQAAGAATDEQERIRALEREIRELLQTNGILRKASASFAQAELGRPFRK